MVNGWMIRTHEWLFPHRCVLCGDQGSDGLDLCAACRRDLIPAGPYQCERCALPLEVAGVCGACLQQAPPFQRAFSCYRYAPPLDYLILGLKFRRRLQLARLLGSLMAENLVSRSGPLPERLIPVPVHHARLRERGYNQALELARPLSQRFHIPIDYRSCRRVRATAAQSLLALEERHRNVKGVFSVDQCINVRHVAIVDDVMTSGHTVSELARALHGAGVVNIEVWVCGRAVSHQ